MNTIKAIPSSLLGRPEAPWVIIDVAVDDDQKWLPAYLYASRRTRFVVRNLRGKKMRSRPSLMNEFGAALQLFDGFGENWHALNECLCYLDEWLPGDGYIMVVTDPSLVLESEDQEEISWFIQTLDEVGEWWSTPIVDNGRFNRRPLPFHTILQCHPDEIVRVHSRFGNLPILQKDGD